MKLVKRISDIPKISPPIALTIGVFDGVHLGHQHLIKILKTYGKPVVITFSNHPITVFTPNRSLTLLTTPEEKASRLEKLGVELIIQLPFTTELKETPYDTFLKKIHAKLPFETFIVGENAAFGKNREGTIKECQKLGEKLHFQAIALPKFEVDGAPVSSGRIRKLLLTEQDALAKKYLGW